MDETSLEPTPGSGAELQAPISADLPVGTILPFVGQFPAALQASGWWVCAGQAMSTVGYSELFSAIGYAFGRPAPDQFNLPDLRGWFLRGATGATSASLRAARDPGWESRRPAVTILPERSAGTDRPLGSTQNYGTAAPHTSFTAQLEHLDVTSHTDDDGCADAPGTYTSDSKTFPTTGGDLESRPVNKYVSYVIKVASTAGPMPVGALATFAGQGDTPAAPAAPAWRVCHGDHVSRFDAPDLFDALGFIHGGVDAKTLVLPDYRGWFQRGVNDRSGTDPEAELRTCPYPQGAPGYQGNAGDKVGSVQGFATAVALNTFTSTIKGIPTHTDSKRVAGDLWNLLKVSGNNTVISLTSAGGDRETRPVNVSVDWYVLSTKAPTPYPVGAVVASGSTLAANAFWLPCDGRTVAVKDHPALYAAIGNTYGGDATNFALPDYVGRFLRGAAYDSGVDPDSATRTTTGKAPAGGVGTLQDWATGKPTKDFYGAVPGYPNDRLGAHGVTATNKAYDNGTLTLTACTGGGDGETRPRNVYVNFYIRAT